MKHLILITALFLTAFVANAEQKFDEIIVNDLYGQQIKLNDYNLPHTRGMLVNVWATWCKPCVKELPSLMKLQLKMPEITVVGLSIDRSPKIIKRFLKRYNYSPDYLVFLQDPNGKQVKQFNILKVPTTLLLDSNGNIIDVIQGERNWSNDLMLAKIRSKLDKAAKQ
jgi:thiol-disulfide isomerase/thioredoxin